jgi:hypothetical protein
MMVSIDGVQRLAAAAAMRFVVPGDEEWPDGIDDRHAEPIQRRGGEPLRLWLRGRGHAVPGGELIYFSDHLIAEAEDFNAVRGCQVFCVNGC